MCFERNLIKQKLPCIIRGKLLSVLVVVRYLGLSLLPQFSLPVKHVSDTFAYDCSVKHVSEQTTETSQHPLHVGYYH